MTTGLYTIVCDFEGGTFVSQVNAVDQRDAIAQWAKVLEAERPMGDASEKIALTAVQCEEHPVSVDGLTRVLVLDRTGRDSARSGQYHSISRMTAFHPKRPFAERRRLQAKLGLVSHAKQQSCDGE